MTQGLQLSLLMTGSDIALAPDAALSDDAAQGQGIMFGQMLNEFTQPAKNSPTEAKLRLLPADVSELSVISQALLLATNTDVSDEASENNPTDDSTLLAASILEQIALKDGTIKAAASKDDIQPPPNDGKNTTNAAADEVTREALTAADAQTKGVNPSANAALANSSENTATDASAQNAAKLPIAAQSNNTAIKAELDAKAEVKASGAKADHASTARYKSTGIIAKDGIATLVAGTKVDSAIPVPPEAKIALVATDAGLEVSTELVDKATIDKYVAKAELLKTEQNLKQSDAKTPVELDSEVMIRKQAELPTLDKQQAGVVENNASNNSANDKKTSTKVLAEKGELSLTGKTDAASQQPSLRQNQEQTSGQNQQQPLADGMLNQSARLNADVSAGRSESAFNSTLLAAEQHRHAGVDKAAAPSIAEQIKQNLNMLRQDAPEQLRERVNLMLRQNIQIAEIRLDPAGLGKIQIKIDMQQDQASVQFVVQQSQAKEALEQHMPRLREMLQQQGIALNDSNVQQQTQQQQERQFEQRDNNSTTTQHGDDSAGDINQPDAVVQVATSISDRLVDYYA
ncbi:flagellar hook-length control protein FliK [Rheinheimera metallidurans]|uniref:flagellar hook-length control protein FliK n=1 Tax=Rheinheimera metallidurans TaxID=2925781 RepID=UPI003001F742